MIEVKALVGVILSLMRPISDNLNIWDVETEEERTERVTSISTNIISVSSSNEDIVMLVGVAWHESGFRRYVDLGHCNHRPKTCDQGKATSIWQIHEPNKKKFEFYRTSRIAAAEHALHRIQGSIGECSRVTPIRGLWMSQYASGHCTKSIIGSGASQELLKYMDQVRYKIGVVKD